MCLLSGIKVSCSPANDPPPSVLYLLVEVESFSTPASPPLPASFLFGPPVVASLYTCSSLSTFPCAPRLSRWLIITSKAKVCRASDNGGLDPQSTGRAFPEPLLAPSTQRFGHLCISLQTTADTRVSHADVSRGVVPLLLLPAAISSVLVETCGTN